MVFFNTWLGSELNFVQHPTGRLLLSTTDPILDSLLSRANDDVRISFGDLNFEANCIFIMTYANFTPDGTDNPPASNLVFPPNTNLFQCQLVVFTYDFVSI